MIPITSFHGQHIALFGLGSSGLATAQALLAGGAQVTAWDDHEVARNQAVDYAIPLQDLYQADFSRFTSLILAPGIPLTHPAPHPLALKARDADIEIIGDIELFFRERAHVAPAAPVITITGTNGKSTTTALIAHLLKVAGRNVQMGGNIGIPLLALDPLKESSIYVLECSSFQIDLTPSIAPSIGVLINITPDHLDRHGDIEIYAQVKSHLVHAAKTALIGVDEPETRKIYAQEQNRKHIYPVSVRTQFEGGYFIQNEREIHGLDGSLLAIISAQSCLRGLHNAQNAAFAVAVATLMGCAPADIQRGLDSFPGLAHRMEEVGRLNNVLYINDSKATNADAAEKALLAFDHIYWIAGGRAKEGGIAPLAPLFSRIAHAYLIGEACEDFARDLHAAQVSYTLSGTMEQAVLDATHAALNSAQAQPVVLLSPACASYDQFRNFEERGNAFRRLVAHCIHERETL